MKIKTNIYMLFVIGILSFGFLPQNTNAATTICTNAIAFATEVENHPEWVGAMWVNEIRTPTVTESCESPNKWYDIDDSGNYCVTKLPVPSGKLLKVVSASACDGAPTYDVIDEYPSGSSEDICLVRDAGQIIRAPWVISESYIGGTACSATTDRVTVKIKIAADNIRYCVLDQNHDPDFASVDIPKGFFLDEVSQAQDGCKFSNAPSYFGKQFILDAVNGSNSGITCAKSYDYIPSGFVATGVQSNSACGVGWKQWTATQVTNQSTIVNVCQVGGTLYNPDGYVIKNKSTSGCNGDTSTDTYTLQKVSGTSITQVCPETKMPTGWYKSNGDGSSCNWTLSQISGDSISNVCIATPDEVSAGWYISNTGGTCSGGRLVTISRIDHPSELVKWIDNTAVPDGYVVKPGTSSCSSGLKCYYISLPEDISNTGLPGAPKYICRSQTWSTSDIPEGWEVGALKHIEGACPSGFSRWELFADIPAPPPNQSSNPEAFITTETPVSGKPAGMPDLDF